MATYSNPGSIADIVSALNAYSLISSIYYQNATNLIFSTPLNSKYFQIVYSSGKVRMQWKDTLTPTQITNESRTISGGTFTLTNKPIKNGTDDFWSGSGKTGTHWVRDVNYTINYTTGVVTNINMTSPVYANYVYPVGMSNFGYVGHTESGRDIAFGGNGYSQIAAYSLVHRCRNFTDGIEIEPVLFAGVAYDSNCVLTAKLIFKDKSSNQVLKNGSDLDGVMGVKSCTHATTEVYTDGRSYLFFQAPWYITANGLTKVTNLLFQW